MEKDQTNLRLNFRQDRSFLDLEIKVYVTYLYIFISGIQAHSF